MTAPCARAGPLWAGRVRGGFHARGAAARAAPAPSLSPPTLVLRRHLRHHNSRTTTMHALGGGPPQTTSPPPTPPPPHHQRRRRQEELVAEAAASAPLPHAGAPRRDAGFFAKRAAMLEALVPGLVEGGNLHALAPREAAELLSRGVGEGGAVCAARLVRLHGAVPRGVDVGDLIRRCPKLLMVFEEDQLKEEEDMQEEEEEGGGLKAHGSAERAAVARLRRLLSFDGGSSNKSASSVEAALADLIRGHPELLIPSVGGRRAIRAKLDLLERGLAKRRARFGSGDDDGANEDDPTRSAAALIAACPDLLARTESALAAVLAELNDVDAALCDEDEEEKDDNAAAAAAALRLHGRVLAARPALLHHYGRGGRAGRGLVREAVEDAPALLELPSARVFRDLLAQRPGTLLQALLPSSPLASAQAPAPAQQQQQQRRWREEWRQQWEQQQPQAQPRADYF